MVAFEAAHLTGLWPWSSLSSVSVTKYERVAAARTSGRFVRQSELSSRLAQNRWVDAVTSVRSSFKLALNLHPKPLFTWLFSLFSPPCGAFEMPGLYIIPMVFLNFVKRSKNVSLQRSQLTEGVTAAVTAAGAVFSQQEVSRYRVACLSDVNKPPVF